MGQIKIDQGLFAGIMFTGPLHNPAFKFHCETCGLGFKTAAGAEKCCERIAELERQRERAKLLRPEIVALAKRGHMPHEIARATDTAYDSVDAIYESFRWRRQRLLGGADAFFAWRAAERKKRGLPPVKIKGGRRQCQPTTAS